MTDFDAETLPLAVAALFRLNHFDVVGPVKLNGAEIDLVATPRASPFGSKVYVEATMEYVNNTKYGKDLTKLVMVQQADPSATCLIVSAVGFTADVRERAAKTRVETLTYAELFSRFEKFQPYVDLLTGETPQGDSLRQLEEIYEPPTFDDSHGSHHALDWMDQWLGDAEAAKSWLIITGEYGTGKSALTRMLQKKWLDRYTLDPTSPIPVRIELGDFTKQFDAQGLLHHFLDHSGLSHVPIDFFWSLIRTGRVTLILDGYDEMAQYLSQRERRQTLKALAELSGDGARGILTSRPNYFSETEELALFDHLYRELSLRSRFSQAEGDKTQQRERDVDELIQRSILDRYERSLRDLSPEQARSLVRNTLQQSPDAAETVIRLLDRVFRTTGEGTEVALSGKPVIISYLIDVASSLQETAETKISEWEVYTMIVDNLALRDMEQTARVRVDERRLFLQSLAIELTKTGDVAINEEHFRSLVATVFRSQLRRHTGQRRTSEIDALFDDLRRSGTLTRASDDGSSSWKFSHNSLREFLAAERMLDELVAGKELRLDPPVSDAMRSLVASRQETAPLLEFVTNAWPDLASNPAVGSYLTLIWDAVTNESSVSPLARAAGTPVRAERLHLADLAFSRIDEPAKLDRATFRDCALLNLSFRSASLLQADFTGSVLEAVSFDDADLSEAVFSNAVLVDASMASTVLMGTNFMGVNSDISLIVEGVSGRERIEGKRALGYLQFYGAATDAVDDYFKWLHHRYFDIVEKVARVLVEKGLVQRLGLEQRGAAARDPRLARRFVKHLETLNYVEAPPGRPELLRITPEGRASLAKITGANHLPVPIVDFLQAN